MSNYAPESKRRRLLQMFAGAPMLPLAGLTGVSAFLSGCGGSSDNDLPPVATPGTGTGTPVATFTTAEFTGMAAPAASSPAALATTTVGSKLKVNFSDGSSNSYNLAYQPFFLTGDRVPDGKGGSVIAGGYFDIKNQPIIDSSVPGRERQFFSDSPDGSSMMTVANATVTGVKGKPVFAVVQFEYNSLNQAGASTYGTLPSPIAVLTLDQDQTTGKLSMVKYHNVDTSSVKGLWITCGASLSPWNTHLSSEEYEPDAFDQGLGGQSLAVLKQFSTNVFGNATTANPYDYGHLPEVSVNPDGTGSIKKHYCLGRYSRELVQVMPDQRTILGGDDYTNGGLFMFVADKAADLAAGGTLYVAKYTTQLTETTTGKLQWVKLGRATHAEIKALVDGGIKATDIMDSTLTDPNDASYTKIVLNKKTAWVRVKAGQEKAAAFLETTATQPSRAAAWRLPRTKARRSTPRTRSPIRPTPISRTRWSKAVRATWPATTSSSRSWCRAAWCRTSWPADRRMTPARPSTANGCRANRPCCWRAKISPATPWATPPIRTRSPAPTT